MKDLGYSTRIFILILLILSSGWFADIQAQNGWERMTDLPTPRGVFKSVVHNGKIYTIGGIKSKNPPYGICNEVYDIATGEWSVMASMDQPRSGLTVEILYNKIYVIGGVHSTSQDYTDILEYDIETDTWITKCTMPEPRFNHISEVLDGKIYIAGGLTIDENGNHPGLKSALVYDPINDLWDTIADLSQERFFARSCLFDNKIFVFGGAPSGVPYRMAHRSIEIYDPEKNVWNLSEDEIPVPFMGGFAVEYGDIMLLMGGFKKVLHEECYNDIYMYVPGNQNDKWTVMDPMPGDRGIMSGNIIDHYLYMIGGMDGVNNGDLVISSDNHWRLDLDSLKSWDGPCHEAAFSDAEPLLAVDSTQMFNLLVTPSCLPVKSVSWESNNEEVATVSSEGMVTGISTGKATITATTFSGECSISRDVTVVDHIPEVYMQVIDEYTTEKLFDCHIYLDGKHFVKGSEDALSVTGWAYDSCFIQINKSNYDDLDTIVVVKSDTTLNISLQYAYQPELSNYSDTLLERTDLLRMMMTQHGWIHLTPQGTTAISDSITKYAVKSKYFTAGRTDVIPLFDIPPGRYRIYGISLGERIAAESYVVQVIDHFPECIIQVKDAVTEEPIDSCRMVVDMQDTIAGNLGEFVLTEIVYDTCTLEISREGYNNFDTTLVVLSDTSYVIYLVGMSTGVAESVLQEVMIYPNPAHDLITIQTREESICSLKIISLSGRVMNKLNPAERSVTVDLSSYQSGVYLVTINSHDKVITRKVIKY